MESVDSTRRDAPGESAAARIPRAAAWLVLGILLWAQRARFPEAPATPELDPSWQQGLSYALAHGFQFGPELIFTFGPLGGFSLARYQPELLWTGLLAFELLFKGLLAWRWIDTLRRWPTALDRAAFLGALLLLAPSLDAFHFASVLMLAVRHLEPSSHGPKRAATEFLIDALLVSAIGLIKFTYMLFCLVALAAILARAWRRDRGEARRRATIALLAFVALWCACGQAPWHLPTYFARSLSIVAGYTEAQAEAGRTREVVTGLIWFGAACVLCLATTLAGSAAAAGQGSVQGSGRGARAWRAALLLAGGALAFKASFTYQLAHGFTFFGFAALAPCVLLPAVDASTRARIGLGVGRLACLLVAVSGLASAYDSFTGMVGLTWGHAGSSLARKATELGKLPSLRARLEADRESLAAQYALPRIAGRVGDSTVDLFGNAQAWLFLNGLRWKPRPVFQSYLTVRPELQELNAAYYRGPEAPDFVLLSPGTIGRRLATMDDGSALSALLGRYVPVAAERGLLLLQRDAAAAARPPPRYEVLEDREVSPGEIVRLDAFPGEALRVRILVRRTPLCVLRTLVLRAPTLGIQVQYQGGTWTRRLVSSMTTEGVLMRPYVESSEDWLQMFTRGLAKRVNAFSLVSQQDWNRFFEPTYRVVIERADGLLPRPELSRELPLVCGSFPTQPASLATRTPARHFQVDGRDVLLLNPDARLVFDPAPGAHRLRGAFGMLPNGREQSDGLDFVVALSDGRGNAREIYRHWIEPRTGGALRLPLDLTFESAPGERLRLTTENPPGRNSAFDLPYWEAVRID